jgi:hypothetical protein
LVLDEHRQMADVTRPVGANEGTLGDWVGMTRIERGERKGFDHR